MSTIENFAEVSVQEQRAFADALIKTINSEHIFTDEVDFEITKVEADEMSGDLAIEVTHADDIEVTRAASWTAADEDDAYSADGDIEYANSLTVDVEYAFKTKEATIEGYTVQLELDDADENDTIDTEINDISYEDSGIGDYEYFGYYGHDSHPYVEVDGTLTVACTCYITFYVTPNSGVSEKPTAESDEI